VLKLLENARLPEIKVKPKATGFKINLSNEIDKKESKAEPEFQKFDL
jgi:hypothetical protein